MTIYGVLWLVLIVLAFYVVGIIVSKNEEGSIDRTDFIKKVEGWRNE